MSEDLTDLAMETVNVMVTGREEEAVNAHVTMDMKGSFAWTVLRDISMRRGTTPSPYVKVSSTAHLKSIKVSVN